MPQAMPSAAPSAMPPSAAPKVSRVACTRLPSSATRPGRKRDRARVRHALGNDEAGARGELPQQHEAEGEQSAFERASRI